MKKIFLSLQILLTLLITFSNSRVLACGIHEDYDFFASLYRSDKVGGDKQFPDLDTTYNPNERRHRGWSQYLAKSLHKTNKLVLTFDDGPHPINTPRLLDILKKYNVKATFFTVAVLVKKYPEIAQRIVNEGHILAGHDWKHDNSNTETEAVFKDGLSKTVRTIKDHYPQREMYYRFPYGAYGRPNSGIDPYHHLNAMKDVSQNLFGENCINFAFWDIDTSDWVSNMKSSDIVQTLLSNINGGPAWKFKKVIVNGRTKYTKEAYTIKNPVAGGVILMHDIHSRTVEAMESFLGKIQSTSIEIIPLNQTEEFEYKNQLCKLLNPLAI